VDYFQSLSRKARLITPIGEKPRAIATTLEVTVTAGACEEVELEGCNADLRFGSR